MGRGSLLDYGTFLQKHHDCAREHGLHTCPQRAWNHFPEGHAATCGRGDNEMLVCGMALGYADPQALAINTFPYTTRSRRRIHHLVG